MHEFIGQIVRATPTYLAEKNPDGTFKPFVPIAEPAAPTLGAVVATFLAWVWQAKA
jgi:hypothetical protein